MKKNKTAEKGEKSISASLSELQNIVAWFEGREEADIETALEKVKAGAELIKSAKKRLVQIENEFEEIRKEMGSDAGHLPEEGL